MSGKIEMTVPGVLIAGKWRDEATTKREGLDGCRNSLIVEMDLHTNMGVGYFQGNPDNDILAGKGAVVVFLLRTGICDQSTLKSMSDADQRFYLISLNHKNTAIPVTELQGMSNQKLVQLGLEWAVISSAITYSNVGSFAKPISFDDVEMTVPGLLIAGGWRDEATTKKEGLDGCRNSLIVTMDLHTNMGVGYFQGNPDNDILAGKAAVVVFLLRTGICDQSTLKSMSDADQRYNLIVSNHKYTDIPVAELQGMSNQKLVQLGAQWCLTSDATSYSGNGSLEKPLLFDPVRKTTEPDNFYYVHTSVHLNPNREIQFNALDNKRTKNVKISGLTLIFDKGNDYKKQMAFQGEDVLDLKALEIFADKVIIREPLRFPGTDVKIYARELIFEEKGNIDTSPAGFKAAAVSPSRGEYGPTDISGKPTYLAADGKNGEKAGDIHLYVRTIIDGNAGKIRFICKGSKGQNAENGGHKRYEPKSTDQPAAGKDLLPVTCGDIRRYVEKFGAVDLWRWPGEVASPEQTPIWDQALNVYAFRDGKVTNCRLVMFDDNAFHCNTRRTFFPSEATRDNQGVFAIPRGAASIANRTDFGKFEKDVDSERKKPGDGEDAYASGKPGDGGRGGRIISYVPTCPLKVELCAVDPGDAGDPQAAIAGKSPGAPYPAYWLEMRIVWKETGIFAVQSDQSPIYSLKNVSAKKGQDFAGKTGAAGSKGAIETNAGKSTSWVRPESLGLLVSYVRDACRNNQREKAREMLDPYYYALFCDKSELPTALLGQFTEIAAIRANLVNNLDYYGNPPGWLPRLDATTNYQIWNVFTQHAARTLYFAQKLEQEWDNIADEQQALTQASTALKVEWDATAAMLQTSYQALTAAKEKLDGIKNQFEGKQLEIERLRLQVAATVIKKMQEQKIFSGVMNIVGGLAQSIPVGQPYLGMAGKTVSLAGNFDWNQPDGSKQLGVFFKDLSKQTGAFLEDNADLFVERSGRGIPKPDVKAKLNLKDQLRAVKGANESYDDKVSGHKKRMDAAMDTQWGEASKSVTERINPMIASLNTKIASLSGDEKKAKEGELKELEAFQRDLKKTATLKRPLAKSKFYGELELLEKEVKGKASETVKLKEELLGNIEAIEKQQSDLASLDAVYAVDKAAREEKTKNLLTDLSGLSDGIGAIGQGIVAITRPYDEKEVDRRIDEALQGSEYREDYLKLISEVKAINAEKAQAVAVFSYQQQFISTCTARISSAALELNAMSNQRQVADGVLDPDIKGYLRGMQSRATENLLWSQYHFVKAWQYEQLTDVSDDFYNLQQWTERFQLFERQKAGLPPPVDAAKKLPPLSEENHQIVARTFLDEEDFLAMGADVRKTALMELIQPILNQRQHHTSMKLNSNKCELTKEQRDHLQKNGCLTFNLIEDFNVCSFTGEKKKIVDIDLEVFKIDGAKNLNVAISFVHSGVSVLLGGKKYYKFQKASDDSPISWGFAYSHSDYLRLIQEDPDENGVWTFGGKGPIKKDAADTDAVNTIIEKELGSKVQYNAYRPSLSSEITLWLNRDLHSDEKKWLEFLARLKSIDKVQFEVKFAYQPT